MATTLTPKAARECRLFIREMDVPLSRPDVGSKNKDVEGKINAEKIEGESTGGGDGMEGRRKREIKRERDR